MSSNGSSAPKSWRVLNRDGTLNVAREGYKKRFGTDGYHSLLSMTWTEFFSLVIGTYLTVNLFFAFAYFLCGPAALSGIRRDNLILHFMDCFFFSVQTFATIGYGRISPLAFVPNLLVTVEAFVGLLSVAMITGLLFARFSKPTAGVIFSNVAIIGVYDGVASLIFRVANKRLSQIVEAHMDVVLIKNEFTKEGEKFRRLYDLKLERSRSPLFALTWTAVHPIDESSPLYGMDSGKMQHAEIEILASLTGVDDTVGEAVNARFSYTPEDIVWNARFKDMITRRPDRKVHIELNKIHEVEAV